MADLRELYQEVILDHSRSPRNFHKMEDATRTAVGNNPLCGDRMTLYLRLDGDRIADASFEGQGCAISKASASMMTDAIKGKTEGEIDELFGLKMGADDFIRKPFPQRLLVERVKAVLRRAQPRDAAAGVVEDKSKVLERGKLKMDPERHTCVWENRPVTLTVTEFLILQSLAARPGVVKSRDALMDAAYDDQVYVDDRTIDSHIKRLRKKFKAVDQSFDVIETLYGVGYRFKE